jgi:hypothetical protein
VSPFEFESGAIIGRPVPVKVAPGEFFVSREMYEDARGVRDALDTAFDRALNPWKYPDRPKVPTFDLFPRLSKLRRQAIEARSRLVGAVEVLRRGVPEEGDDW